MMGGLRFFGAAPAYGELYYNLHEQTAWCLAQLDRRFTEDQKSPFALVSADGILTRKVILSALKIRTALKSTRTEVIWIDVFGDTGPSAFWDALLSGLIELWFALPLFNISFFERKLVSTGAFSSEEPNRGSEHEAGRILDQMSGTEIVLVLDLRADPGDLDEFFNGTIRRIDALLARQSNNRLAAALLGPPALKDARCLRALGTSFQPVALMEPEVAELLRMSESSSFAAAGFGQIKRHNSVADHDGVSDSTARTAATPLALIGEPILDSARQYLYSRSSQHTEGMKHLLAEGSLETLRNGGVALTSAGAKRYRNPRSLSQFEQSRVLLEANTAHLLSALRPTRLHRIEHSPELIDKALSAHQSILENLSACLAARLSRSKTLGTYLSARLSEVLRERDVNALTDEAALLDDALKYLELIAFREPQFFDRSLFKLAEDLTYALNGVAPRSSSSAAQYIQAQRITRLSHLYDNSPAEVRRRLGAIDSKRYVHQALAVLESDSAPSSPVDDMRSAYLAGWLRGDIGDAAAARVHLDSAAALAGPRDDQASDDMPSAVEKSADAFELAVQALFFSDAPLGAPLSDRLAIGLRQHGIVASSVEMIQLARAGQIGRKPIPSGAARQKSCWHILFTRFDFGPATMIASRLLFDWGWPVELICVPDTGSVEMIEPQCVGRKVVLGGPDTPGPVGSFIRRSIPNISKLWQLRYNESFFQPILLRSERGESPTIILAASIVGDILKAWVKFVLEVGPLQQSGEKAMDLAVFGSVLPTVLTTASKQLTELFIQRVVKAVESRLDKQNQDASQNDLESLNVALHKASNCTDAPEASNVLVKALSDDTHSRAVLTGVMDEISNVAVYGRLEEILSELRSFERSTNYFRDMALLLRTMSLAEHRLVSGNLEMAKKVRKFADGFSNVKSRLDNIIDDYETKAIWNVEGRDIAINDLFVIANSFFEFVRVTHK